MLMIHPKKRNAVSAICYVAKVVLPPLVAKVIAMVAAKNDQVVLPFVHFSAKVIYILLNEFPS